VPGGYGSFATAKPYRVGRWRGKEAEPFFRGFAHDDAHLAEGESRVFSGESPVIVVRGPQRRVLQFDCSGQTPDEHVDYGAAIASILRTVRFSTKATKQSRMQH
jgi:hypothetical protein